MDPLHPLRISVCQHVPFEGPAAIAAWFRARGHRVSTHGLWLQHRLPTVGESDLLVVMGGPMGLVDLDEYRWMRDEIDTIARFIAADVPVLGVCLGAQLIASSLGARVYRGRHREIGWWPVAFPRAVAPPGWDPWLTALPARATVLHWHADTFDLPTGATRVAASAASANQGFVYGTSTVALQFHLESTAESVRSLARASGGEIGGGPYEVSRSRAEEQLVLGEHRHGAGARSILGSLLETLERHAGAIRARTR